MNLKSLIRDVPDFPKKGILFRDISPLLADPEAFNYACNKLIEGKDLTQVDLFAGIESRGFIFAAFLAAVHGKGFLPLRKAGKLPHPVLKESYALEYGEATLEVQPGSSRVMILDDVLATGGTLTAAVKLCQKAGYSVENVAVLINLTALNSIKFRERPIHSVLQY